MLYRPRAGRATLRLMGRRSVSSSGVSWPRNGARAEVLGIGGSRMKSAAPLASTYTRGVLLSLSGITPTAAQVIVTGKQPNFFVVDGRELTMCLVRTSTWLGSFGS